MGLLDYLDPDAIRGKLKGLLGGMPVSQLATGQGKVSMAGLLDRLKGMPVFSPDAGESAYEAAMQIGPMGLGKIVYHGSPHKFDKFDASKIGTGEGAQAYGHGVYLADSPGVAKTYTSVNQPAYLNAGVRAIVDDVMKEATEKGLKGKEARLWANHEITRLAMERPEYARRQWFDAANNIDDILDKPVGALYKADLPDEWIPKMLDWDKPLSEQLELVNKLASMNEDVAYSVKMGAAGDVSKGGWRGRDLVEMLRDRMNSGGARAEYSKYGGPSSAEFLRAAGIPGIRYLDGGSRSKGQGSYNYVVFPGLEDQVKILERNGIPLSGLLGGQ